MHYFLRPWDENRGDKFAGRGTSLWYFEVDESGSVLRQVEAYESGKVLKYDEAKSRDEYGGLTQAIHLEEFREFRISPDQFNGRWLMGEG